MLNINFDDYRKALNAFGWNDGENPDEDDVTISGDYRDEERNVCFKKESAHDDCHGWVEAAAALLTALPPGVISPEVAWSTDKRRLLLKVVHEESGSIHWEDRNVTISSTGALGFTQVQPFNSERYNDRGVTCIVDASLNLYRPDENLRAGAQFFNDKCLNSGAFSGDWTQPGDDNMALLKKALAYYNGGDENILKNNSWQTIVTSPNNLGMTKEVNYVSRFLGECDEIVPGLDCN